MWEIIKASANIGQWFGLGGIGIAGAVAVMIYFPWLRKYAIMAVVGIVVGLSIYGKGVYDNAVLEEARQKQVEKKAVDRGHKARTNAHSAVKRGVRDGWCRDCDK